MSTEHDEKAGPCVGGPADGKTIRHRGVVASMPDGEEYFWQEITVDGQPVTGYWRWHAIGVGLSLRMLSEGYCATSSQP